MVDNINAVLGAAYVVPQILLPLGISFFTFTQIAYLVDSYRGEAKEYDFLNYALFVTFFPHLIAGPILHHHEMISQFKSHRNLSIRHRNILLGLFTFSIGLFKKAVIADTFAIWANAGFDGTAQLDFFNAWLTSLSYTFQLYFDFSGYCDMAIGASPLFNIWLPINFNSPYKALDIQDFWRRRHMTLSRYLRDYLYIPLGGNRCSPGRVYFNLMATFVLGGLWHGANWMFIIWGALHGGALVLHRFWSGRGWSMPKPLAWLVTFLFINVTWVFFRAKDMDDARRILGGMVDFASIQQLPLVAIPCNQLAWGGWLTDYLLRWFPTGLVANFLCFCAVVVAFVIVRQKNSFDLMQSGLSRKKMTGALSLFCFAGWEQWLTSQGVQAFHVVLGPNKDSVYGDMAPGWAQALKPSATDTLIAGMKPGQYVDVRPAMLKARSEFSQALYYKTDTHWNRLGGWIAMRALGDELARTAPGLHTLSGQQVRPGTAAQRNGGDLANFLKVERDLA